MGQLKSYIRPFYGYMLLTVMIKLFGAVVELLIPYLLQTMIDDVVPTGRRDWILLCGGGMILCALFISVSSGGFEKIKAAVPYAPRVTTLFQR